MRYWYLDSADFITMILLDKGYYDYDYLEVEKKHRINPDTISIMSDEEVATELARAIIPGTTEFVHSPKYLTPELLQAEVMADVNQK